MYLLGVVRRGKRLLLVVVSFRNKDQSNRIANNYSYRADILIKTGE